MTRALLARLGLLALALAVGGSWMHALSGQTLTLPWPGAGELSVFAPERLGLLALIPALIALSPAGAAAGRSHLALLLRAACAVCLVVALSRPEPLAGLRPVSLVALVDVSNSIADAELERARETVRALERVRGDGVLRVVGFAARAQPVGSAAALVRARGEAHTDLQAAVQAAYRLLEPGLSPRILLISDGGETRGDLDQEAERARALGVRIDHLPVNPLPPGGEVWVESLALPRDLAPGVPFKLRARIGSNGPASARAALYREPEPSALEARAITLEAGQHELEFETSVKLPGRVEYRLELSNVAADRWAENNRASAAALVPGPPRVLLIDSEPEQVAALTAALRQRDFAVDLRAPAAWPREPALGQYDFVVLSDVPARELPPRSMELLRDYVQDGGGLLLAGGANGFGLGGYQGTLIEQLAPVRMAGEEWQEEPSLALALIIDCSGSMAGDKLALARQAAALTAQTLADADLIEVIGFTSEPERRVRLQPAGNRASIAQSIARLAASGGTQLYPALDAAHRDLRAARVRLKHAILLTDGQTQESGVEEVAIAMHADGITLSTVGLGAEINRGLLEALAGLGGGRAYITQDARNVPQIFVSEATRQKQSSAITRSARVYVEQRARFLDGIPIELAPPLGGFVGTQAKPRPAEVILRSQAGAPILARWRVGLGHVLAWTSDLKPRWSADWLRWPSFDRLMAQLLREHMRTAPARELPIDARVERERVNVAIDAIDPDDRFWNRLAGEVRLIDRTGRARATALEQWAPGRYTAELPLPGLGAFTLEADLREGAERVARAHGALAVPYAREYWPQSRQPIALERASAATGGARLTRAVDAFAPHQGMRARRSLWPALAWLALGLFLAHEVVRRVRLFDTTSGSRRNGG